MKIKNLIDGPLALVICAVLWSTGEVPSAKTILGGVLILGFIMIRSVVQNRKVEK